MFFLSNSIRISFWIWFLSLLVYESEIYNDNNFFTTDISKLP